MIFIEVYGPVGSDRIVRLLHAVRGRKNGMGTYRTDNPK